MFGQESVQVVREFLLVSLAERSRSATHVNATRAHRIEKIPHIEAGADVFGRVQLAPWAERMTAFLDDLRCEWYVTCDNEITGFEFVDYSDLHFRADDELEYEVGRHSVSGNTDRFTFLFRKP